MPDEEGFRAAAAAFHGSDAVLTELSRITDTPDIRAAYAREFLQNCAALPADDFHWVRQTLRTKFTAKDLALKEWDRRIKEARIELTEATYANGSGWKAHLDMTDKGPRPILINALVALREAPEWQGVLAFDEFSDCTVTRAATPWSRAPGRWLGIDDSRLCAWLQEQGIRINTAIAREAVEVVADEHAYHPLREYLTGLPAWDGEDRLSTWLYRFMGVVPTHDSALDSYLSSVAKMWPISAVARIMRPGCKVDTCPVFEGAQGKFKSTAIENLAGSGWFTDCLSVLGTKDARMEVHGVWVIEIADLDSYRRAEMNTIRAFISAKRDRYRKPYESRISDVARQSVFTATSNDDSWAKDPDEERRMWPIRCIGTVDAVALKDIRDVFWAEALARLNAGEPWWFGGSSEVAQTAREEQRSRYVQHPWAETIEAYLRQRVLTEATTAQLLNTAAACPNSRSTQGEARIVGQILRGMGWERKKRRQASSWLWFYERPE